MKRVVWHEAFLEILKTIESYAKLGCMFNCADGVLRWIFPIILILSADYEEQCVKSFYHLGNPLIIGMFCLDASWHLSAALIVTVHVQFVSFRVIVSLISPKHTH